MPSRRPSDLPLLEVRGVSKTFPGTRALIDVSLDVRAGEIVAVLGQNGSGKSTLVKVLAGIYEPDPGAQINVTDGLGHGIRGAEAHNALHFIHQDLALVLSLSTIENMDLGPVPWYRALLPFRRARETARAKELITRFGGSFDVSRTLAALKPAERTIVAIARELSGWTSPTQVLVLDEPTAALHGREVERLLAAVRLLAAEGAGVLYITHRLDEVFRLADRVVVLRDGELIADRAVATLTEADLVALIAGKDLEGLSSRDAPASNSLGPVLLEAADIAGGSVRRFDLAIRAGEVVGVAGLLGSGAENVANVLFGTTSRTRGTITVSGKQLKENHPNESRLAGLGLVPADRMGHAVFANLTVRENLTVPRLVASARHLWNIGIRAERREILDWAEELDIRPRATEKDIQLLSGGNQQKVILARWLRNDPRVLLLDEPTQGVDVGVKANIYRLIREIAASGRAVVVASTDAKELATVCDRVLVMADGEVVNELGHSEISEAAILTASLGDELSRSRQD